MLISDQVYGYLNGAIADLHNNYHVASPFPHIVLDNILNSNDLLKVSQEFPGPQDGKWWTYENVLERKLARNDIHNFPASIRNLISELQSNRFVSFIESLTGIRGLIVDHTLNGGGIHSILGPSKGNSRTGGYLGIHSDYNYHPITRLDRRVNVLLYLNNGWFDHWNGNLELWDNQMTRCVQSIVPIFNRMVIFNVNDFAYHGHPEPLQCPEDVTRKSIALYYYSNGRPSGEISEPHSTLFQRRPQDPDDRETDRLRVQRAQRRLT